MEKEQLEKVRSLRRFLKTRADGLVVTLLGIAFLAYSVDQFRAMSRKVNWIMSPYLFPMIVAGMAILLGIGIIVESRGKDEKQAKADAEGGRSTLRRALDVVLVITMAVLHEIALPYTGFIPATAVFLAVMVLFLGERRWYIFVPVAVLTPLILYAIFRLGLNVRLP